MSNRGVNWNVSSIVFVENSLALILLELILSAWISLLVEWVYWLVVISVLVELLI